MREESPACHVGLQKPLVQAARPIARQDLGHLQAGTGSHQDAKCRLSHSCKGGSAMDREPMTQQQTERDDYASAKAIADHILKGDQ